MEITAQLVKQLRDKTGAGMMDCKRALVETDGDISLASEYLRKKGLMDAAQKSSRTTADGLIAFAISSDKKTAAIVEVNSETDFVARNEKFQDLVQAISEAALRDENNVLITKTKNGLLIQEEINRLISIVGENLTFRRASRLSVKNGTISAYIHGSVKPEMGKIGVLVSLEAEGDFCQVKSGDFGKKIAMHIAAANPAYLCSKCVPQEVIDKEKEIVMEQAKELGKPENIAEKMAEGRVKKFFEECVLLNQTFVVDGKTKIQDVIDLFNKENNFNIKVTGFTKFVLGEGIEKVETNFAEEVASFIKK